ncbi:hypothetical protein GMES_2283 [Paraglaciecola mesophila KMM 241]|uniref:Uncharacterized protein n=1 Tax=Paraglaciecola mesophila KMM 241 TaxID=1128912 RepID=K6XVC2_9ALTE|nr:hypothetical protein GMES_2283 [Paraglaciecola mesophila KMM 241]
MVLSYYSEHAFLNLKTAYCVLFRFVSCNHYLVAVHPLALT